MEEALTVECHVHLLEGERNSRILMFQAIPRVGEYVAFSLNGKSDENGVLVLEGYLVKRILHTAPPGTNPIVIVYVKKARGPKKAPRPAKRKKPE